MGHEMDNPSWMFCTWRGRRKGGFSEMVGKDSMSGKAIETNTLVAPPGRIAAYEIEWFVDIDTGLELPMKRSARKREKQGSIFLQMPSLLTKTLIQLALRHV